MFLSPHFCYSIEHVSFEEPVDFTITHEKNKEGICVVQPGPIRPGSVFLQGSAGQANA